MLTEDQWETLLISLRAGQCVPFLGAGASLGYEGAVGLPTGGQLAAALADDVDYPGTDKQDFLRVAQYYEMVRNSPLLLRRFISKRILVPDAVPGKVHVAIAALPFHTVLTTNFDNLMEQAFSDYRGPNGEQKAPQKAFYKLRGNEEKLAEPTPEAPLVYKLHGTVEQSTTMVVTEDDVVDFLTCVMLKSPPLPEPVRAVFTNYSILFIGYGLKDWNVRVLMRAMRERRGLVGMPGMPSFAVQRCPEEPGLAKEWEASIAYWNRTEGLTCIDTDAVHFVSELQRRFESGGGQ